VPSGEGLTETQIREISHAVQSAEDETGLHFSVFVGSPEGDPVEYAHRLHAAMGERGRDAVLVSVAPAQRRLEIVTGTEAAHRLDDRACALAALSMSSAFSGGDLVGGLLAGVRMLAESAGRARHGGLAAG
jgi:uncharacterized membrane protein YgcG